MILIRVMQKEPAMQQDYVNVIILSLELIAILVLTIYTLPVVTNVCFL